MRIHHSTNRERALTLVELLVVIFVLGAFALFFAAQPDHNAKARALRIQCINNFKQCGLGFRDWARDHGDKFPMEVAETNGGTAEFTSGANLWRHFQVMSNELAIPKVLICPSDSRLAATNFWTLSNANISYFVGINVDERVPGGILFGDRNITNGTPIKDGILELTANHPAGWTSELQNKVGNVAMADGSVQQWSIAGLQTAVAHSGVATNRLQMPILNS